MPSSVIRRIAYDVEAAKLFITFVSGRTYAYSDVPPEVHGAFCAHASKGEFFNAFIRDHYRFDEVVGRSTKGGRR